MSSLTQEQEIWLQAWLNKWGAWIYTERIEKRQSSVIAEYISKVKPFSYPSREKCNDDQGLLINAVINLLKLVDEIAFHLIVARYAFCLSDNKIASGYRVKVKPRIMPTRAGQSDYRKPSYRTCLREVKSIFKRAEFFIYQHVINELQKIENKSVDKKCVIRSLTDLA
ncbi:antiterminator Q family protein [Photorhabdus sp. APURE]|uniref:antiterminator Q family protein n=1 Tax=Photorhabdus aballayi TaxID=2991723 RepID=UPI00223E7047|nr:antiterminator Q family protein [Photorhabdus aballayi]MCW7549215.1 antiterminator Q family protein [Photorhabdus aballayi]